MPIKSFLKNEKGNSAILVLGLLSVMVVLFVLVISFAGALVVKEQAMSTSQQAALAATATLYEELPSFIDLYEKELKKIEEEKEKEEEEQEGEDEQSEEPEPADEEDEDDKNIKELIDEEIDLISGSMAGYSLNEIRNEAIDRILAKQLDLGIAEGLLKKKMAEELEHDWIKEMKESARNTILVNGGELEGAEMIVFDDGQIVVKSSHEVKAAGGGFLSGISENLYKTSRGPELKFVQKLPGWDGRTYSLQ